MRKLIIVIVAALALIGFYLLGRFVLFPVPGASVGELEEHAIGSGQEQLARLFTATEELKRSAGLSLFGEPFEWADPRTQPFRMPDELLRAIEAGERRAYPIEVAALAASIARSRAHGRQHARIVEVLEFEGVPSPDSSGRLGYYLIEIDGDRHDVFGRGGEADIIRSRVLEDHEALGAAIAVKAFVDLTRGGEIGDALRATKRARELDPKSPSVRAIEGTVLISAGDIEAGERELNAALSLSPDPARKNLIGGLKLSMGDLRGADGLVSDALRGDPNLAEAYVTRAAIDLSSDQLSAARRALERAEALKPSLPSLPILFAQLDLLEGRTSQALERVREQLEAFPDDPQTHLASLPIFQATHRYSDLRRSVQAVLRLSPPDQRELLREEIAAVFGRTALQPPIDEAPARHRAIAADPEDNAEKGVDEPDAMPNFELRIDPSLGIAPPDFPLNPPAFD